MDKTKITKYLYLTVLVTILLVAAFFRLYHIRDYQVFLGDQGRDVLVVKRIIVDHKPTLLGPTSSVGGFFLGPFYYYLMIIPLAVSNLDPVGPAIMVALFSLATTYLCYWYGKRFYSVPAGLIAAAVYAISRLVIEYSRSSWNPNVLPFFSLLLITAFTVILTGKTTRQLWWFVLIGSCLGIVIQLHYTSVALYFLSIVLFVLYVIKMLYLKEYQTIKKTFAAIGAMLLGLIIFLSPFILFELKHGHQNINNIAQFVVSDRDKGFSGGYSYEFIVRDTAFRLFLRLVSGGYDLFTFSNITPTSQPQQTAYVVSSVIFVIIIGILIALYKMLSRFAVHVKQRTASRSVLDDVNGYITTLWTNPTAVAWIVLSMWFIVGVGFWGFYKKSIYDYYYSYMYALPVLLFAFSTETILQFKSRRFNQNYGIRVLLVSMKVFTLGVVVLTLAQNYKSVNAIAPAMQVDRAEIVARDIIKHKSDGPYNFALITAGNSDHAYRYFLEINGQAPRALEDVVTTQLMVFCELENCEPLGNSLWEVAGFGPSTIVGQWESIGWPMYRLEHLPETKYMEGKPVQKG